MQKRIVPAVWFQNKLHPAALPTRKPAALELFERDLARVTGGIITDPSSSLTYSDGHPCDTSDPS